MVIQANQEQTVHQVLLDLQGYKDRRDKWAKLDQRDGRANRGNQALLEDRAIEDIQDNLVFLDLLDHLGCRFVTINNNNDTIIFKTTQDRRDSKIIIKTKII